MLKYKSKKGRVMEKFQILKDLIKFNTVEDRDNLQIMLYLADYLQKLGFSTKFYEDEYTKKRCLLAHIGNGNELGFVCHTDTIGAGRGWTVSTDELTIAGDKLAGLGICDMKGGIACLLESLAQINFADIKKGLSLYFTYDEEVTFDGIRLFREYGVEFPNNIIMPYATNLRPVYTTKGCIEYNVIINGVEAHSSKLDEGVNAIDKTITFIAELKEFFRNIERDRNPEFAIPNTTLNISQIKGGSAINKVAGDCSLFFDFRTIRAEHHDLIINKIKDMCLKYEAYATIINNILPIVNANESFIKFTETITDKKRAAISLVTEASFIENANCLILGCGPVKMGEPNEYISSFSYETCIDVYKRIIEKMCF